MQASAMEEKLSMNHATQWTALPSPMVLIVSFNRSSFSRTMDLMVIEQEKTKERIMKMGNMLEMPSKKVSNT